MKLLFYLLRSKIFFFLLTATIILSLNLIPLITHIRHSPPGRTFAMIHNNSQDFFFYQSLMNEGANGAWLTTDPYTTEPHQSSVIFSYFLWLGKLSKLFGISYAVTYHLTRIILGALFLFATFSLLLFLKIPYPRLAFFFFLFAEPFMNGREPYMYWWTGMDAIRRVAYLPHHMAGNVLLVATVICIIQYVSQSKKEKKYLFLVLLLAPLLAFIHTPSLFILLLILPFAVIIFSLVNTLTLKAGDLKDPLIKIKWLLVYWVIGLLLLLLMYSQTNQGFPWSQYIDWEKNLQFPLGNELIGAFGILFPFALLGGLKALVSKRFDYIFITLWFFLPILFVPIAPYLSISNIRLVQGAPYVSLAILAVLGVRTIEDILNNNSKINRAHPKIPIVETVLNAITFVNPMRRYFARKNTTKEKLGVSEQFGIEGVPLIPILTLIIFTIFTLPTLSWSLKDQIREFWPIYTNIYLDNKLFPAFAFINQNFKPRTKTISAFYTGNYLPAFTHTVSFAGHFGYTYNVEKKQAEIDNFFKNKMKPQEAKEFLLSNKIDLVFQGPEEKPLYNTYLYPEFLQVVYDLEGITIYTFRK